MNATNNDNIRSSAEFDYDSGELLPPTVVAEEGVQKNILEAVRAAIAENPNAATDPRVYANGDGSFTFTAHWNELPYVSDDGEVVGWLPSYRAAERFEASLHTTLPDGYAFEAETFARLAIFRD